MASEMNKEQWIDNIMSSTRGMSKAEPANGFYEHVQQRLNKKVGVKSIAMPVKQWAAAAILLLALNAGSIAYCLGHDSKTDENNNNPFAAAMQPESTYNY